MWNYSLLIRIIHSKKIFCLILIFFVTIVQCAPKKFFSSPSFDGYIYLKSVKNEKYKINAFITFNIKNDLLISNFINFKFYSQLISYECGQNTPIIIEELLTENPYGKGIKNESKRELKKARNLISPSYPSLLKETCV